jgi:hypothetical protein
MRAVSSGCTGRCSRSAGVAQHRSEFVERAGVDELVDRFTDHGPATTTTAHEIPQQERALPGEHVVLDHRGPAQSPAGVEDLLGTGRSTCSTAGNGPHLTHARTRQRDAAPGPILAGHGRRDDIARIARALANRAQRLHEQVEARQSARGRNVRPGVLSRVVRARYWDLAARALGGPAGHQRSQGNACQPARVLTRLIGPRPSPWPWGLALNIEPTYLKLPRRDYRRTNEAVVRTAAPEIGQSIAAPVKPGMVMSRATTGSSMASMAMSRSTSPSSSPWKSS